MNDWFIKTEERQEYTGCQLLPSILKLNLGIIANTIINRKKLKVLNTGKAEVKLSLFADDLMVYPESPREWAKNLHKQ